MVIHIEDFSNVAIQPTPMESKGSLEKFPMKMATRVSDKDFTWNFSLCKAWMYATFSHQCLNCGHYIRPRVVSHSFRFPGRKLGTKSEFAYLLKRNKEKLSARDLSCCAFWQTTFKKSDSASMRVHALECSMRRVFLYLFHVSGWLILHWIVIFLPVLMFALLRIGNFNAS